MFYLDSLLAVFDYRNRGLGSEMIYYIEEIAEKLGAEIIQEDVKQSENEEYELRLKFYRNLGYEITGTPGINKIREQLNNDKRR
ncbi:GNAT family N-acetyltransferase [Bacteroides fragilis]|nr:GNAT family N-acetyltransferase [Bacteroides fragilis]